MKNLDLNSYFKAWLNKFSQAFLLYLQYIKDNFEYSIIAEFDVNASSNEVLEREKIEKDRHHTKNSKYGYNEN